MWSEIGLGSCAYFSGWIHPWIKKKQKKKNENKQINKYIDGGTYKKKNYKPHAVVSDKSETQYKLVVFNLGLVNESVFGPFSCQGSL